MAKQASRRYCYEYPRPALTVDVAILRPRKEDKVTGRQGDKVTKKGKAGSTFSPRHRVTPSSLEVLLIRRKREPF
jgi:hypothetical protein